MTNTDLQSFRVVRRGYDIDEVDAFLVAQATAWGEALDNATAQIADLERELEARQLNGAGPETSEVPAVQSSVSTSLVDADDESELRLRLEALDAEHRARMSRYAAAEAAMRAKVEDLDETRSALVSGLEAIAKGGLAGLGEAEELMVEVGIRPKLSPPEPPVDPTWESPASPQ